MNSMKNEVRLRLLGEVISGYLEQMKTIEFHKSDCHGYDCFRFSTALLSEIVPNTKNGMGIWKNGRALMYEVENTGRKLFCRLSVSSKGLTKSQQKRIDILRDAVIDPLDLTEDFSIRKWVYDLSSDNYELMSSLQEFIEIELPYFETELKRWLNDSAHRIKPLPEITEEETHTLLVEGSAYRCLSNRYERNRSARAKCIAIHGSACNICGFDFGDTFGYQFTGRIEVHHIVPVSMIAEDYDVDPERDLIPVCPNCHMIFHSKPNGGVFSVQEMKKMKDKV